MASKRKPRSKRAPRAKRIAKFAQLFFVDAPYRDAVLRVAKGAPESLKLVINGNIYDGKLQLTDRDVKKVQTFLQSGKFKVTGRSQTGKTLFAWLDEALQPHKGEGAPPPWEDPT